MHHAIVLWLALVPKGPLEEAIYAAQQVRIYDDRIDVNATWTQVAEGVDRIAGCRAAMDAAAASGVAKDQPIELDKHLDTTKLPQKEGKTTLGLLRGFCDAKEGKVALLRAYLAIKEAWRAGEDLKRFPKMPSSRLTDYAEKHRVCTREAAQALLTNDPGFAYERPAVNLGEAEEKVCKPLALGVAAARAALPHEATKLGGDKGRILEAEQLYAVKVYGSGKLPLTTEGDFKHAKVWHVELADQDDAGNRSWIVRSHRFDGDKLVETKEKKGAGHEAPDEAFF